MGFDKLSSKTGIIDHRRSTCKLCLFGLFWRDAAIWLARPPFGVSPGLVHVSCAQRAGLAS